MLKLEMGSEFYVEDLLRCQKIVDEWNEKHPHNVDTRAAYLHTVYVNQIGRKAVCIIVGFFDDELMTVGYQTSHPETALQTALQNAEFLRFHLCQMVEIDEIP